VNVAAPITNSLLVTAQTLTLSAPVSGDLGIFGEVVTFAPGAKVAGMVTIKAPKPIDVPASVASADRVTFIAVDSNLKRLGVLVFALILATLIGIIPSLGWLITLALVCFGFGAMATSRLSRAGRKLPGTAT
jgi:hypothetical protein